MESDYKTKEEVHNRARLIIGKSLGELTSSVTNTSSKSSMGDVFEAWFGKPKDSDSSPDLGIVELKATPYKKLKNGQYSSKERLVLNIINYMDIVNENFEQSHFLYKNNVIELAFYEYTKDKPRLDCFFSNVALFEMSKNPADFEIIRNDWHTIQSYVLEGRAEELTESATNYLAACTKGANAKSVRKQPFSKIPAKQRAFSLKSSYMTQLLRKYILGDEKSESILSDSSELKHTSLREFITNRFKPFIGKSTKQIAQEVNIKLAKNKATNNTLVRGMLKLDTKTNKLDRIDELNKASYILKTVQLNNKGTNKESMSFPAFKFKDLVTQTWVDEDGAPSADLNILFSESTFLFIVFQKDNNNTNIFKGIKFFNVPKSTIDGPIKFVWEDTINKLTKGVKLVHNNNRNTNNFINLTDNKVIHVRPHARKASYINSSFANQLPTKAQWTNKPATYSDDYMTTQSFFLNNNYVHQIIEDLIDD